VDLADVVLAGAEDEDLLDATPGIRRTRGRARELQILSVEADRFDLRRGPSALM
jgi:hypothetical protein